MRRGTQKAWAPVALALLFSVGCAPPDSGLPVLSEVQSATLVNAAGEPFSLSELEGDVWVGHFMFTRCADTCARMTAEFRALQREIGPREHLRWVSISADPSYDRPEVLRAYGEKLGADPRHWYFLTGEADAISRLADRSFMLPVMASGEDGTLITHSQKFAVVDQAMQIRAFHDHFQPDNAERLAGEIDALSRDSS